MENIEKYKAEFINSLEEQIYRKQVNADFDIARIPDVEKLRADRMAEHGEVTKQIEALDPTDHTRATRDKKKGLELKQTKLEELCLQCDDTITQIKISVQKAIDEAKFLKLRMEFAKTWVPKVEEAVTEEK